MRPTTKKPPRAATIGKRDLRAQFAALPYRIDDGMTEILLITSRDTARWILPKGWPMAGKTPAEAATAEAWEEAGATGRMHDVCLGHYSYRKVFSEQDDLACIVAVFPLQVEKLADSFPESGQRRRQWFSPKKAASLVDEPELKRILKRFTPEGLAH